MSARGKGAKGLLVAKRHQKQQRARDALDGISRPAIKRLSLRGGIKRIAEPVYAETRVMMRQFARDVLRDAVTLAEHRQRKTLTVRDVKTALKRRGHTMYGFSEK